MDDRITTLPTMLLFSGEVAGKACEAFNAKAREKAGDMEKDACIEQIGVDSFDHLADNLRKSLSERIGKKLVDAQRRCAGRSAGDDEFEEEIDPDDMGLLNTVLMIDRTVLQDWKEREKDARDIVGMRRRAVLIVIEDEDDFEDGEHQELVEWVQTLEWIDNCWWIDQQNTETDISLPERIDQAAAWLFCAIFDKTAPFLKNESWSGIDVRASAGRAKNIVGSFHVEEIPFKAEANLAVIVSVFFHEFLFPKNGNGAAGRPNRLRLFKMMTEIRSRAGEPGYEGPYFNIPLYRSQDAVTIFMNQSFRFGARRGDVVFMAVEEVRKTKRVLGSLQDAHEITRQRDDYRQLIDRIRKKVAGPRERQGPGDGNVSDSPAGGGPVREDGDSPFDPRDSSREDLRRTNLDDVALATQPPAGAEAKDYKPVANMLSFAHKSGVWGLAAFVVAMFLLWPYFADEPKYCKFVPLLRPEHYAIIFLHSMVLWLFLSLHEGGRRYGNADRRQGLGTAIVAGCVVVMTALLLEWCERILEFLPELFFMFVDVDHSFRFHLPSTGRMYFWAAASFAMALFAIKARFEKMTSDRRDYAMLKKFFAMGLGTVLLFLFPHWFQGALLLEELKLPYHGFYRLSEFVQFHAHWLAIPCLLLSWHVGMVAFSIAKTEHQEREGRMKAVDSNFRTAALYHESVEARVASLRNLIDDLRKEIQKLQDEAPEMFEEEGAGWMGAVPDAPVPVSIVQREEIVDRAAFCQKIDNILSQYLAVLQGKESLREDEEIARIRNIILENRKTRDWIDRAFGEKFGETLLSFLPEPQKRKERHSGPLPEEKKKLTKPERFLFGCQSFQCFMDKWMETCLDKLGGADGKYAQAANDAVFEAIRGRFSRIVKNHDTSWRLSAPNKTPRCVIVGQRDNEPGLESTKRTRLGEAPVAQEGALEARPNETELDRRLREAFGSPPGVVFVRSDFSESFKIIHYEQYTGE